MRRIHVFVSGLVQGVFFRRNILIEAKRLGLKGWVKNLDDGRVEAVFEGEDEVVETMLKFCRKGPLFAKVTDIKVSEEKYKGCFKYFERR